MTSSLKPYIFLILSVLIFTGIYFLSYSRLIRVYQCYGLAFLNQPNVFVSSVCHLPHSSKIFLPSEYPSLSIFIFILPLLFSSKYYEIFFLLLTCLIFLLTFLTLRRFFSSASANYFLIFTLLSGLGTALSRFDIIPALFVLLTLLAAAKNRFFLSYFFLTIGIALKVYPVILFPFLLIHHYRHSSLPKFLRTVLFFFLINFVLFFTYSKSLIYLSHRPFHIESFPASLIALSTIFSKLQIYFANSFGSLNIFSIHSSWLFPVLNFSLGFSFFIFYLFILLIQWKRPTSLLSTFTFILLILLITAKVFSPQYLLWLNPLLSVFIFKNRSLTLLWILICLLTGLIYPFLYYDFKFLPHASIPNLYLLVVSIIRNFLLVLFALKLFRHYFANNPNQGDQTLMA
jgi:hypothetical protein